MTAAMALAAARRTFQLASSSSLYASSLSLRCLKRILVDFHYCPLKG